ncbi:S-methyl-5'-thioinosine phosphorylase [Dasania sp. GY-MA-18]|uniref:Probable S-methyl-5'-thioinosine phosphorylase n=1 Tax=Dasania phycosphaerae TaxID=2950436 RepID=A0A9J6RK38_9GAMM|nr:MULTISPECIES: S-methyl-5'-thioinosine phosphorylase [Dasania]MCR8921921.1 S-methyl-5'-thioinosine phosphorylase [Dasania sp. GY-MA-18]MCZ0864349.1 S-methyl-5'-thioinosine phosphorylase [Dasania phycosphaerae]MCZ0868077.1 S-methyl-5'-thioinosine phosphorylase [Dasania phycosphaerae]
MAKQAVVAIIGGTGLNEFAAGSQVPGGRSTPYGETSSAIICTPLSAQGVGLSCLFLARHGNPHAIAPHQVNYRANIWALKQQGVTDIIAVNAVGGINPAMTAACLVLPDQLIDYSYGREQSFFDGVANPLQHIDFTHPFSAQLSGQLQKAASAVNIPIHSGGVYGVTQGPRLETAAEIRRMAQDGCDIVGMTAMPEAALARELEINYASLCLVVNPAAGCSEQLITMDDIHEVIDQGMGQVRAVLSQALPAIISGCPQ